jgi:hypothetical protein
MTGSRAAVPGTNPGSICSSPPDRLLEIAEILALGLMRLQARKSSRKPAEFGESSLHLSPDQSGDAASFSTRTSP